MWKSGRNGPYRRRRAGETARHPSVMPPIWPATRAISWLLPVARTAAATRKAREYEELTKACQRTVSPVLGALVAGTLSADNVQCRRNAGGGRRMLPPRLAVRHPGSCLNPPSLSYLMIRMFILCSFWSRRKLDAMRVFSTERKRVERRRTQRPAPALRARNRNFDRGVQFPGDLRGGVIGGSDPDGRVMGQMEKTMRAIMGKWAQLRWLL